MVDRVAALESTFVKQDAKAHKTKIQARTYPVRALFCHSRSASKEKCQRMDNTNKIPKYDVLKGHEFTNNLKTLLGCKNFHELSDMTEIPASTFGTWNSKDRTSHELIIRLHLALNIPVRDLALGYHQIATNPALDEQKISESEMSYNASSDTPLEIAHKSTITVETFTLQNGILENRRATLFDSDLLADFNPKSLMAVTTPEATYILDIAINQGVSGTYLADIDGFLSLNDLQRLPGNKLAIAFNGSILEVEEKSITIKGKLVAEINLK